MLTWKIDLLDTDYGCYAEVCYVDDDRSEVPIHIVLGLTVVQSAIDEQNTPFSKIQQTLIYDSVVKERDIIWGILSEQGTLKGVEDLEETRDFEGIRNVEGGEDLEKLGDIKGVTYLESAKSWREQGIFCHKEIS